MRSTQVRSARVGSPAAAATISVSSRTTPSCLFAVQDACRGQDLDPDVVSVPVDIRQRAGGKVVDEGRRVLSEQRQFRDLLPPHDGRGDVSGQSVLVGKSPLCRVHVDHGHWSLLSNGYATRKLEIGHRDRGPSTLLAGAGIRRRAGGSTRPRTVPVLPPRRSARQGGGPSCCWGAAGGGTLGSLLGPRGHRVRRRSGRVS